VGVVTGVWLASLVWQRKLADAEAELIQLALEDAQRRRGEP
jgi:hypothetical protein